MRIFLLHIWKWLASFGTQRRCPSFSLREYQIRNSVTVAEEENHIMNCYAYAKMLRGCITCSDTLKGKAIHCHSIKRGGCLDVFAQNILLNFYSKSDLISDAFLLFDEMPLKNIVSFVTLIQGCVENGKFSQACQLFLRLHRNGHELNPFVFTVILKLSADLGLLALCKCIHACICKLGHGPNAYVGTALINIYSLHGLVGDAKAVFDGILAKDTVCWTGMLTCYAENCYDEEAMKIFSEMRQSGLKANNFTISSLLKSSVSLDNLYLGKSIHACATKTNYENDLYVVGSLLDMYAKCGDINDARLIFESAGHCSVAIWSLMIARYAQANKNEEALEIFQHMGQAFVMPNEFSFSSVLQACTSLFCLDLGEQIHCSTVKVGLDFDAFVTNALMSLYAKCDQMDASIKMFSNLNHKNDVSWNIIIVGYMQSGFEEDALGMFREMGVAQVQRTRVTYCGALRACAGLAVLEQVNQIHTLIAKSIFANDKGVGNALIDAYAKCGCIVDARKVFDALSERDEISWNSMISGYSLHGLCMDALELFGRMCEADVNPDEITFVGVLSACSKIGLVDQGKLYFRYMSKYYGIEPCMEHYTCMVKLLGRSGHLNEAFKFIQDMPLEPDILVWRALFGVCVVHKDVKLGEICADKLFKMEPLDETTHVLLANMYATAGRWENMAYVRKLMRSKGVNKVPGLSWIEIQNEIHVFAVGDTGHPSLRIIRAMLEYLRLKIKKEGYAAQRNVVLHDIEDAEKEHLLWMHSERLTLAFGLVAIPQGRPVRIIKNLSFCSDCHALFKLISRVVQRELIVRDMNRFHYFVNGKCSCGDYW